MFGAQQFLERHGSRSVPREEVAPDPIEVDGIEVHFRKYFQGEVPLIGGVGGSIALVLKQPAKIKTFIRVMPVTSKLGNFSAPFITLWRRAKTEEAALKALEKRWRYLVHRLIREAKDHLGTDFIIVEGSHVAGCPQAMSVKRAMVKGYWDAEKSLQLIACSPRALS